MSHGVVTCAIEGAYKMICGDPEAVPAVDGYVPDNIDLHAERFRKFETTGELENVTGAAFDRCVFIKYSGTVRWDGVYSRGQLMRTWRMVIRIGYLFGGHETETEKIMGDDEQGIAKLLKKDQFWPQCGAGCVNGYVAKNSSQTRLAPDRVINEIVVEVTTTA